jgi:hypothetical protein
MSSFNGIQYTECYEVKPNTIITKGTKLNKDMFTLPIRMDVTKVSSNSIKSLQDIDTKVALENLYGCDILTSTRIEGENQWDNDQDRYVDITSSDNFGGSDVRPGDSVDVFIYDTVTKQFIEQADNLLVLNIKDKDGIYYADSKDSKFLPYTIYFKDNNSDFKKIIDMLSSATNKVEISIHGNRPNTKNSVINNSNNNGILNLK